MNIRHGVIALLLATLSGAALAADSEASADEAAFNQLKSLVGTWEGREKGKPESEIIRIAYESVSGGKTVIERMMPGTPNEMITVYYLASGKLRATHYCGIGNQPAFELTSSKDGMLVFDFAGGTGFDPAKDPHVHSGHLRLLAPDQLEGRWTFFADGKEKSAMHLLLRKK